MNEENKKSTQKKLIDLEEEWEFYNQIGLEAETKCQSIDANMKQLRILAFKDTKRLAKTRFSKLMEV